MTNTYYTYLIATLLVSNIRVAATSDNSKLSQGQFDVRCAFVGGMCTTENICENGFGGDIIKKRCKVDECCVPQQTYACNESSGVCRFSCDEHAPAKMGSGLCGAAVRKRSLCGVLCLSLLAALPFLF
uniref:Uncharacterized protein n=1 Tax=Ditylenchus dipsaci TaxID=166011 RepID=A0A915EJM8_9BILA